MDKKEDKDKHILEDPKPKSPTSDQDISQDLSYARLEALRKSTHARLEVLKKNIQVYEKVMTKLNEVSEKFYGTQVDQNLDTGIVIRKEDHFKKSKALFSSLGCRSIKQLHHKLSTFNSVESKEIQGLESRIHALLHDGDYVYKDFKNNDGSKKISFLDCLKEFDESDGVGYETLKSLKTRAVNHAKNLSHLVINLMFLNSKFHGMMAKFQVVGDSLKWVSQSEDSVVIKRFLDLLRIANESKKRKAAMMLEEKEAAGVEGNIDKELEEDVTDKRILVLLKEIFSLELFWMRRGWPDSKMFLIMDAFPVMVSDMEKCEEAFKWLETEVKCLELCTSNVGEDSQEGDDYKAMDAKINELWNRIEESESKLDIEWLEILYS